MNRIVSGVFFGIFFTILYFIWFPTSDYIVFIIIFVFMFILGQIKWVNKIFSKCIKQKEERRIQKQKEEREQKEYFKKIEDEEYSKEMGRIKANEKYNEPDKQSFFEGLKGLVNSDAYNDNKSKEQYEEKEKKIKNITEDKKDWANDKIY